MEADAPLTALGPEVAPGVRVLPVRTPTLPPATQTNAWVLGTSRVTVVEPASPWDDEQERLAKALHGLEVERIVLTHHHGDHIGGVEDLRRRTGAPVLAHPETAARVPFAVDLALDEGDAIDVEGAVWTALHTPGHAPGHVCLHERATGSVVAGDMVAGVGTIVLDPPDGDLGLYLASLERLRELGAAVLLPAHGPAIRDAGGLLSQYIDHRNLRTAQYEAVLRERGPSTPLEIASVVYQGVVAPEWYPLAARQVLCHLHWLLGKGTVQERPHGQWARRE